MKKKLYIILPIVFSIIIFAYLSINNICGKDNFRCFKSSFSSDQIHFIKKYFFPYKLISQLENQIYDLHPLYQEINFKNQNNDIRILNDIELSNGKILKFHKLSNGFYYGINNLTPGSGYIDFHNENIIILSSHGVLAYTNNIEKNFSLKQIKNNIQEFISKDNFIKDQWFSLKDIHVYNDVVFISYTEEVESDCWNTSIISAKINYEAMSFKKIFSPSECIHIRKNIDKEFNAHQSGGRIINFMNNQILLSIGDYRSRYLAQDKNSINGKIIKIDLDTYDYEIISMGHRNPQGLLYDMENNFILETEHGPKGGDEINIIEVEEINSKNILNYGWAISSAGEHYRSNNEKLEKYPLHNSHKEFGFVEPLKSFVPSIGISEIAKIKKDSYVVSSMKDKSLYFFELDNNKNLINLERVEVHERIRDLKINNGKIYLFLEDSASIGVVSL